MGGIPNLTSSVPAHWEARRLGQFGRFYKGSGGTKADMVDAGVPCVRYGDLYTWHQHFIHDTKSYVTESVAGDYSRVRHGDVLFAASGETHEDIGRSAEVRLSGDAVCGGDIVGFRPNTAFAPGFLGYAADSHHARHQKARSGRGFTVVHISATALKQLVIAVPPIEEQRRIVAFLDHETARIDELVQEQERLRGYVDELREVVISRAVLWGVGSEPFGDEVAGTSAGIASAWPVSQLRYVVHPDRPITYGIVQAGPHVDDGVPYIRTGDMSGDVLPDSGYMKASWEIAQQYRRSRVSEGDLVVAIRATVGKALRVPACLDGANLTQGTARVAPGPQVDARFLQFYFESRFAREHFKAIAKGATFKEITLDALRRFPVPLPPLQVQAAIVDHLGTKVSELFRLGAASQALVDRLLERRSALITAAVTGQIDVSTWTPPNGWLSPEAA